MRHSQPHSRRRTRRQVAEINVVPYIDVMLVLLVIFMITAPLLQTGVEIDLPDAVAAPIKDDGQGQEPLVLSVDSGGQWFLNVGDDPESPLDQLEIQKLAAAVLRLDPNRSVLVAGDSSIDYGQIIQAMVTLQLAGADKVGLQTEQPNN